MIPALETLPVRGRRAVVRADLNVPVVGGVVGDSTRIGRFVPTVHRLLVRGSGVVVLGHRGRPGGKRDNSLSLAPVAAALEVALGVPVGFVRDCVGAEAESATAALRPGAVLLLENVRFHPGEEQNDPAFGAALARHGDFFVNDAFSCAHRAHASLHAITRFLPSCGGPGLIREVEALQAVLENPAPPVAAVVGGAKISSKIGVLENLVPRMDSLVIGGAMANTFLAAQGVAVGRSLCEPDRFGTARAILAAARESGCAILLPEDVVVAERLAGGVPTQVAAVGQVPAEAMILDLGPASVERISAMLSRSRSLLWNGPLGAFEVEPFDAATRAIAQHAASLCRSGSLVAVGGGGDTVAALNAAGAGRAMTWLSTAGGAFLEWLEGRRLPGIAVLEDAVRAPA